MNAKEGYLQGYAIFFNPNLHAFIIPISCAPLPPKRTRFMGEIKEAEIYINGLRKTDRATTSMNASTTKYFTFLLGMHQ
mgnify:CR=1 FL=1